MITPIFHNGMTSRNGSADSTGIDPAGRQETQTDAEHVIRGATLTQQAVQSVRKTQYPVTMDTSRYWQRKSNGRGIISGVMWHEHGAGHCLSQVPRQRRCRARASDLFWQGTQSLFWAGLWAARAKIESDVPKHLNWLIFYEIIYIYARNLQMSPQAAQHNLPDRRLQLMV